MTPKADDDVFNEISDAVMKAVQEWCDLRHAATGEDRRELAAVSGKALVLMGVTFAGNACGLTADEGLSIGKQCLQSIQQTARGKIR